MRLRHFSLPLAGLLACFAMTTECGQQADDHGELTLTIVSEDWNGWDRDHVPTAETTRLEVTDGAEVEVGRSYTDPLVVSITAVRGDAVEFTTSTPMAPGLDGGGIDLNNLRVEYTVSVDETVEFSTPTYDSGYHYDVTLESEN